MNIGRKAKDITGNRFGLLTAISRDFSRREKGQYWIFKCDCGESKSIRSSYVVTGVRKNCGCVARQASRERIKHGMYLSPEFSCWQSMKHRCSNHNNASYAAYGGRGISVCARWENSFESFYEDMGPRPSSKHSIERIDNDSGYEPKNCRWATKSEQASNRRNTRHFAYNGKSLTIAQWAKQTGVPDATTRSRISRGWTAKEVLFGK